MLTKTDDMLNYRVTVAQHQHWSQYCETYGCMGWSFGVHFGFENNRGFPFGIVGLVSLKNLIFRKQLA